MGARAGRLLRTFNLENRVDREISKTKPKPAPRHVTTADSAPGAQYISEVNKKNDALLAWLKQVYVKSRDPILQVTVAAELKQAEHVGHRPLKSSLRGDHFLISDITAVPQGKLLIVEALTALNNHKLSPQTWTAEKIAKEYTLDLADAKALTKFFIPFNVKIIPPKSEERKQIKDS